MDQIQLRAYSDYEKAYAASINEPIKFWEEVAAAFSWQEPWHKTLEWEFATPKVKWFQGGRLNITENCLDRHLKTQGDDIALLWEPNDPKEQEVRLTYKELHSEVCRFANVLKARGVI